ncbi:MAG: chemotaxis response regulator protein-glutamate methylesterase [Proteobacteria bacterium]|nr:chemotaxis response regulator protein-glutamate methylesterase [Pseudomonadota bacterium]
MVVDDAVVVRGLVSRWVNEETDMAVVASLRTGREAVDQIERINPDVVILDVEMPDLDGISALPLLLQKKRDLIVIMASTLTLRNAEVSLRALALGAADYIPKPESNRAVTTSTTFRRDLVEKIRHLGAARARRAGVQPAAARPAALRVPDPAGRPQPGVARAEGAGAALHGVAAPIRLRPFGAIMPRVLLIGSSTGGPQALTQVIAGLKAVIAKAPVLITQHMPPTFTTILAQHIARACGYPAREAEHGEVIKAGNVYVAPGGRHMLVTRRDNIPVIVLDDGPPVNYCKPAVDPLFTSAAGVWGPQILATILTGMGSDGALGGAEIVHAGGNVIAQDEASSVVWGMPAAAAHAGICAAVLPLDQIASRIVRAFSGVS